ncbi:MAG: hypothetical protein CMI00_03735 [Oceanospirillaceae bacterium]|nr:hypothetical protein [Oceanospirillaceae bacterium]|tara:strand:- start:7576 stop:8298 length:723 start_codon:yes stop_codon:yes gene_type:complete
MSLLPAWWLWPGGGAVSDKLESVTEKGDIASTASAERPALSTESAANPFVTVQPVSSVDERQKDELVESEPAASPVIPVSDNPPLNSDEYQAYLRSYLPPEALSHPVFDQYLNGSLGYVQAFPDWLTSQDSVPLTTEELASLEEQLKTLGINEYNLAETQRLHTALQYEQARASEDVADFQWRVEQYDELLNDLVPSAADPQLVTDRLAEQLFTEEERARALQYHRGLYQRPPEQESAGD